MNVLESEKVLRERGLFEDYYMASVEGFTYTFHDTENEVKRLCENLGKDKPLEYMEISKREYNRIRKNQDLKYTGL